MSRTGESGEAYRSPLPRLRPLQRGRGRVGTKCARWVVVLLSVFTLGAAVDRVFLVNVRALETPVPALMEDFQGSEDTQTRKSLLAAGKMQSAQFIEFLRGVADGNGPLAADARTYLEQLRKRIDATPTQDHR